MLIKAKIKTGCKSFYVKKSGNIIEIGVCSLPEKGKANLEAIKVLSEYYSIPSSNIKLVKGAKSKEKLFGIYSIIYKFKLSNIIGILMRC